MNILGRILAFFKPEKKEEKGIPGNGPFRTPSDRDPAGCVECEWCADHSKYTCYRHGCMKPGVGWFCTLEPDHDEPCRVIRESVFPDGIPKWFEVGEDVPRW